MADDIHGTTLGVSRHYEAGEHLCPACAAHDCDRQRARRITSGKGKEVRISAVAVGLLLEGWPVHQVLAKEIGPLLREALIAKAGEKRG